MKLPEHVTRVLNGGHLLHVVCLPTGCTYKQVCDVYVAYTLHQYGAQPVVVFDDHDNYTSTKTAELFHSTMQMPVANVVEDSCSNCMELSDLIAGKRFYTMYTRSANILSLSPLFKLESLPQTATAAKLNSDWAYRTLQQWSVTICL